MDSLTTIFSQFRALWARWDASQRVIIGGATVLCVIAVVGTMFWATRPDYVVLASNLSPQRAAEIMGLLDDAQITATMNYAGSSVSVAGSDVGRARLALKDVITPLESDDTDGGGFFPSSPDQVEDQRVRQQERRIAETLTQIQGIRTARVHISKPPSSPFAIEQVATSASVMLESTPGATLTRAKAQSIIAFVAQTVPGLTPDQITLLDTEGRQLAESGTASSVMSEQLEYQRMVEAVRAGKALSMLSLMLGPGRATVEVTADVDFRKTQRIQKLYDSENKATTQEIIESTSMQNMLQPDAPAGVDANVVATVIDPGGNRNSTQKTEKTDTTYTPGETTETIDEPPGVIKRLTVAAIVDLNSTEPTTEGGGAAVAAAPAVTAEQVEQVIRQAVGFDAIRGDEINVVVAPLKPLVVGPAAPSPLAWWDTYGPVVQWGILGVSVIGMLTVGLLLVRRMTPVAVTPVKESGLSLEEMRRLMALSEQAKQNPDVVASILNNWLDEPQDQPSQTESSAPRTQRRAA